MSRYYNMNGQPITLEEWSDLFAAERRVDNDVRGDVTVSTVYLGLNHNWGDGPPLIFETMIFGGDHGETQWRYSTREEAEEGHRRACALAFGETA
ncbi:MAG: hypothetical protein NUW01_09070 [Gemmatimonadaceae bacterium]|nr:hypothetical protein [Gemmatimonadaceae bacterium]